MINQNLLLTGDDGYNLTKSLRFRSSASAYMNRTPASAGNRRTFTISAWVKRGSIGVADSALFTSTDGTNRFYSRFEADDKLNIYFVTGGSSYDLATSMVFRDPSAWYHIVIVGDTTQATNTDRIKIYVNGIRQTYTGTYIPQNTDTMWNYTSQQNICKKDTSGSYFDGYMAEVYNIDGQALTPSSFGETDPITGVWKPKKFVGTYGTNGFYLPFSDSTTASYAGSFNGSNQWLNGALSTAIGTGDFTVEGWTYQNTVTNYQNWFATDRGAGGFNIGTDAAGTFTFYSNSARQIDVAGVIKTGRWQHFAAVRSGTTLTAYLDGVSIGTATVSTNFSATNFYIGALDNSPQELLNAQLSNIRVTGTAVYTGNFTPSTQPLTAIAGTKLLTLQNSTIIDNSGNSILITNNNSVVTAVSNPFLGTNIASDQSGNGNNWKPNNISLTAGTTYDSMVDVPTMSALASNYCVLSPIDAYDNPPTEGNLRRTGVGHGGSPWSSCRGTLGVSSGKWYFEATLTGSTGSTGNNMVGIMTTATSTLSDAYGGAVSRSYQANGGMQGDNSTGTVSSASSGDVIMCAFDIDAGKVWFGKNGTWFNSGVPASGTGNVFTSVPTTPVVPALHMYGNTGDNYGWFTNFGQRPFSYTPPTGFVALNTFNLPEPSIKAGNKQMDATTYTGNNGTQSVVNAGGFSPDLVWVKNRTNAFTHLLYDKVRGVGTLKAISSSETTAEGGMSDNSTFGYLSALNSDGFTVVSGSNANSYTNSSSNAYIGWQWKANGTSSSNTAGSITSTVSANPTAGFSVVTWSGNSTIGATVGHGLGVAPSMIIVKQRNGAESWPVYHASLGATKYIDLNGTANASTSISRWNNTSPSSSVITLYNDSATNGSGSNYVAYCFAEVAGYSKFGSYTGNGSTDGTFVNLGFRPKFVMIKRVDAGDTTSWFMFDTTRATYNIVPVELYANSSSAEGSDNKIDILSNGIKIRSTSSTVNSSSITYIYMAFAENPFKYSLAR